MTFRPIAIEQIELSRPVKGIGPTDAAGRRYSRARVLVRLHSRPLGLLVLDMPEQGLTSDALRSAVGDTLGPAVEEHLRQDGVTDTSDFVHSGVPEISAPCCLRRRTEVLRDAPFVSVTLATRNRPDLAERSLRALMALDYPNYEVILVDGSPNDDTFKIVHDAFPEIRYLRTDGALCAARNIAIHEASGEFLAFTDDDAVVDPHWLVELISALQGSDRIACVTGLVLPYEIETPAQLWFEEKGEYRGPGGESLNLNYGFAPKSVSLATRGRGSLLPYATERIGAGVSMAWRTSVLKCFGVDMAFEGIGGEDLAMYFDALIRGYEIVYEPNAIVWHQHRTTEEGIRSQHYWHSVGLAAFLTRCLVKHPRRIPDFLARLPRGILYGLQSGSLRNRAKMDYRPANLLQSELSGLMKGPYLYFKGARAARNRAGTA